MLAYYYFLDKIKKKLSTFIIQSLHVFPRRLQHQSAAVLGFIGWRRRSVCRLQTAGIQQNTAELLLGELEAFFCFTNWCALHLCQAFSSGASTAEKMHLDMSLLHGKFFFFSFSRLAFKSGKITWGNFLCAIIGSRLELPVGNKSGELLSCRVCSAAL